MVRPNIPAGIPAGAKKIVKRVAVPAVTFATVSLYACLALGRFGEYYYFFDLLSHFVLQYAVAAILLAVVTLGLRKKLVAVALVPAIGWCGFSLAGSDLAITDRSAGMKGDIYYLNAYIGNTSPKAVVEDLRARAPKYVAIVECGAGLYAAIRDSWLYASDFRHEEGVESLCFFTNEPIKEGGMARIGKYPVGAVTLADGSRLFIVHPLPPVSPELARAQKDFFEGLAGELASAKNFLVVGDFNSTAYSPVFSARFGRYAPKAVYSWNTGGILRLPIDYALSDRPLVARPLPDVGSDHLPLLVDFPQTPKIEKKTP